MTKFENLILNNFNEYEEKIKNYKKDLDNTNFELEKLKIEFSKEQQNNSLLKIQLENEKKKIEEIQSLLGDKNALNETMEERINLQLKDIENYKKNKEKLEVSLNSNIVKYKLKEEENEVLLSVFYSILSKKKDKYELNIKKLTAEVRHEIERLNKQFTFFK